MYTAFWPRAALESSGNSASRIGSDSLCFWFWNPCIPCLTVPKSSYVGYDPQFLADLAKCLPNLHFVCGNKMFTGWKSLLRQASHNWWMSDRCKVTPDSFYRHCNVICMHNSTDSGVRTSDNCHSDPRKELLKKKKKKSLYYLFIHLSSNRIKWKNLD